MPELMTVEELGRYLRFSKKTIYCLLKRGSLPAIRIGSKWRFDKAEIDSWLHQGAEEVRHGVLVVDDDEVIRELFRNTLEEEGITVVTTATSAEGLQQVRQRGFGLAFLDLEMPDMDGAELFRQIKIIRPGQPVIIITGYPDSEMMKRALNEGPCGVMNKPFDASAILAAVSSFLRAARDG